MSRRAGAGARSCRSCAATAGATAATSCTSAMAVLFIGVAASSAFQHARDVRAAPGQTRERRRLRRQLRQADHARSCRRGGRLEKIALGADLDGAQGRQAGRAAAHRARLLPRRGAVRDGQLVRAIFEGEATSEVGMKAGVAARRLDRGAARPRPRSTRSSTGRRGSATAGQAGRRAGPRRRPGCGTSTATGAFRRRRVPPDRLAAGGVDLARRADRLRRRADRPVAGARRRAGAASAAGYAARVAQDLGRA